MTAKELKYLRFNFADKLGRHVTLREMSELLIVDARHYRRFESPTDPRYGGQVPARMAQLALLTEAYVKLTGELPDISTK